MLLMPYFMGIDLGTSSLKTLIVNSRGELQGGSAGEYRFDAPRNGYAEQQPHVWWDACRNSIRAALAKSGILPGEIQALSFSGQMHGAVLLDKDCEPVRPAILHCDTRSSGELKKIQDMLEEKGCPLGQYNPVYTGFLLVSLLWIRERSLKTMSGYGTP